MRGVIQADHGSLLSARSKQIETVRHIGACRGLEGY